VDAVKAQRSSRATAPDPGIALEAVTKRFGRTTAVDAVSLDIAAGEFFVVLGPSGCGKSTLLRLVAGLEPLDEGRIALNGKEVAGPGRHVAPEARSVAVVFQSYALWPHMTVARNVAFPAEAAGLSRSAVAAVVDEALEAVSLAALADRRPAALSGGQQQRVALARCLASRAGTVLMDEPLANLDPHLRAAMEEELSRVHRASGGTTLYITHDQREAMALADRIAVMQEGRLLQVADPVALYERPSCEAVARFIGRSAVLAAVVEKVEGRRALVRAGPLAFEAGCATGTLAGPARVVVRPHHVVVLPPEDPSGVGALAGDASYRGGLWEQSMRVDDLPPIPVDVRGAPHRGPVRIRLVDGWILNEDGPA
jgi:iron(III) transport system ATP-binding protein